MNDIYKPIFDYVSSLEIIDTHEHLPGREEYEYSDLNTDILKEYLIHYFSTDLKSSGLSADDFAVVVDNTKPLMERWKIVEPYWENCRYTGYGRAIDYTVQGLYGVERFDGTTIEKLNKLFMEARTNHPYEWVLKEKCNIRTCIVDNMDLNPTDDFSHLFLSLIRMYLYEALPRLMRWPKKPGWMLPVLIIGLNLPDSW